MNHIQQNSKRTEVRHVTRCVKKASKETAARKRKREFCRAWVDLVSNHLKGLLRAAAMPSAPRYADIVSERDAQDFVRELIRRQIDRAELDNVPPNVAASGDSEVRDAFNVLLSLQSQRGTFLATIKDVKSWPRVRTIFGVPPFGFLRPEDDDVLNASGIARNRVHMASQSGMLSFAEIGVGHYSDDATRRYKVVGDDDNTSTEIPVRKARSARRLVLDARVAVAISVKERASILKSRDVQRQRAITVPRVGEVLRLQAHKDFGILEPLQVTVRTVETKDLRSPVCRLYCVR